MPDQAPLTNEDGKMICQLLSKSSPIGLPPSTCPDSQLPYRSAGPLIDIVSILPQLPEGNEATIRAALKDAGINVNASCSAKVAFAPAAARDNDLVRMASKLSRGVIRGKRTLPETLAEIKTWVEIFTEKVVGDEISVEKARMKAVEFLTRDVTSGRSLPTGWDSGLSDEDKERFGLSFTSENERWDSERIVAWLASEFERHISSDRAGWLQAIEVALSKITNNPDLTIIEEEKILRFMSEHSKGLPLTTLRGRMTKIRRGEIQGENHSELAAAVLVELSKLGEIRHDGGHFWQWKGAHWSKVDQGEILKLICEDFGFYPAARRNSDLRGIMAKAAIQAAKPLAQTGISGVNFANGFVTENGELQPHNPDHGMTYTLPYRYLPELAGHMPIFSSFLHDCWGEDPDYQDKMDALQEAMGATLFGLAPRFQRAFAAIGMPSSGKTRIPELMIGLMPPDVTCAITPQDWDDRFLPAMMFGKLLNFCGELSESRFIKGDVFKLIVDGSEITAQNKNQNAFKYRPSCAHWFCGNHLPKTRDTSDGFNRRWLFLTFNKPVPEAKKIPNLELLILEHEREAVAAWAVQGVIRLMKNGEYTIPSSHLAAVDRAANTNNSVRHFLSASPRLRIGRKAHGGLVLNSTTAVRLYSEYWSFCIATASARRAGFAAFQNQMRGLSVRFNFVVDEKPTTTNGTSETVYRFITIA
jgi:hypothetical protein